MLLLAGLLTANLGAQTLLVSSFEGAVLEPLFPIVNDEFQLPPGPVAGQLEWIIQQLAEDDTSIAEINARFDPELWLSQISAEQTRDFIAAIRNDFPDGFISDLIALSPIRATAVVDSPSAPPGTVGFLTLRTRFSGNQTIIQFGFQPFSGEVQFIEDQNLTLTQAADKFQTLGADSSLYIGRIGSDNQCSSVIERDPNSLRATASVFKLWVLGAVANGFNIGNLMQDDLVELVASELASGGDINLEPLGTQFTVTELATLMMANSDNTATDLLHELVGRDAVGDIVNAYGVAQPAVLTPFLNISEQFHLFFSFSLNDALSYLNGSESFQQQFLSNQIEPLGPYVPGTGGFNNESLLTAGSWRATALDICRTFASLRNLANGSDALSVVNLALGSQAAQPNVRNAWDRVWYKGGSLASGSTGLHVLTNVWMLENSGEDAFVVIALANDPAGGIETFAVQSVTSRLLELVAEM